MIVRGQAEWQALVYLRKLRKISVPGVSKYYGEGGREGEGQRGGEGEGRGGEGGRGTLTWPPLLDFLLFVLAVSQLCLGG